MHLFLFRTCYSYCRQYDSTYAAWMLFRHTFA